MTNKIEIGLSFEGSFLSPDFVDRYDLGLFKCFWKIMWYDLGLFKCFWKIMFVHTKVV